MHWPVHSFSRSHSCPSAGWERPSRCQGSCSTTFCFPPSWSLRSPLIDWKSFGVRASVYLIGIALTLLVGQVFIVFAYRYASAVKVGPFIYTVIVFTALIDWVLWDRAPTLFVILGMALVIGGGLIAIRKKPERVASIRRGSRT